MGTEMEERRQMNEDQIDTIVKGIADKLLFSVDAETHARHHQTMDIWMERENKKAIFREKVKAQVGGWAIVSVLGAIGTGTWHAVQYLRDHLK